MDNSIDAPILEEDFRLPPERFASLPTSAMWRKDFALA
jgi:hypothetical protein